MSTGHERTETQLSSLEGSYRKLRVGTARHTHVLLHALPQIPQQPKPTTKSTTKQGSMENGTPGTQVQLRRK
eukprot:4249017-Amphidinium_carterae.1